MKLVDKVLRFGEGRKVKLLEAIVAEVAALEPQTQPLTDEQLRAKTDEFKRRLAEGETLDDLLPEAFADGPRSRLAVGRHAAVRRPGHGRRGAAPGRHRRDEDR